MREISSFIGARPPLSDANTQSKKYVLHSVSAFALSTMPRLGDADRVCFANRSIPRRRRLAKIPVFVSAGTRPTPAAPIYAGVQTMRARICSALSCDMFARVVWLRLRRAAKPLTFALPFVARTRHAWLARLTRARGGCFLRGRKALLNDFWYFWSHKSTIKEKLLYDSIGSSKAPLPTN